MTGFWYAFTWQQQEMIAAIRTAILYGGDQAIAASRGEGKTSLFEAMLTKYTLQGVIDFSVLFRSTGAMAEDSLATIKDALESNERLRADYPEVCWPIAALEGVPNRAHYQLVTGHRHDNGEPFSMVPSRFTWCGQEIVLPKVPGSPSAGAIIATRGLDSEVRGIKKKGKRPKVAGIDDPDTSETVNSEDQATKLEKRIDRGIAGLGGQQRSIARIMLTSLQNRRCVSYKFTDPKQKPTWKGKRFRYLLKKPERQDLWDDYLQLRINDLQTGDEYARKAHAFYLENREKMDAGAEVANPNRFDGQTLPDGTQLEVSALQRYFNEVARIGPEAVASEYDNDPPEETGPVESGITAHRIQRQLSGYDRRIVPPGCTKVTQGIDVKKAALHWVVRAWRPDGLTYFTIDYGIHEVIGTKFRSDDGLDIAIERAILARLEATDRAEYLTTTGELLPCARTLIDARYRRDAVFKACAAAGLRVNPIMGYGKSTGCAGPNFSAVQKATHDRRPGNHWNLVRKGTVWIVEADTDHWKEWEHARWMTAPSNTGAMLLFGIGSDDEDRKSADERAHHAYAHHICNETEIEEPYKGGIRRRWKAKSENVHWLDASYYADVAADIEGIRLPGPVVTRPTKTVPSGTHTTAEPRPRMSLDQLARAARR